MPSGWCARCPLLAGARGTPGARGREEALRSPEAFHQRHNRRSSFASKEEKNLVLE